MPLPAGALAGLGPAAADVVGVAENRTYNEAALARAGLTTTDLAALRSIAPAKQLVEPSVCPDQAHLSANFVSEPEVIRAEPTPDEQREIERLLASHSAGYVGAPDEEATIYESLDVHRILREYDLRAGA